MKAREIAFKILCDIEENNNYSNIAINKHFKNLKISNQDRGLATEIVYGVVENKCGICHKFFPAFQPCIRGNECFMGSDNKYLVF